MQRPNDSPVSPTEREGRCVLRRRYLEARRAGMTRDEARVFAHDEQIDVGLLRRLVTDGCPRDMLARILL